MSLRTAIWPAVSALAIGVVMSGCAGRQPAPKVNPPVGTPGAAAVVRTAESMLGKPYRLGGTRPDGFDCSGLVVYVFSRQGVAVPRDLKRQATFGSPVARSGVRAGDLVFFTTTGPGPTHVAIAIDRDRFIHAPRSGAVVRVESMQSTYWAQRFLFGRRLMH